VVSHLQEDGGDKDEEQNMRRSCKKKKFRTMELAQEHGNSLMSGKRVRLPEQRPMGVYWCSRHEGWHVGHTDWREMGKRYGDHRANQIRERKG